MQAEHAKQYAQHTDAELIRMIAGKDQHAFSEIYERFSPRLFGLALKILANKNLAEDVLQEVFLALWRKADQFSEKRGGALAWLLILCRNRCIDRLRSQDKQRRRSTTLDDGYLQQLVANVSSNPQAAADANETQEIVQRALQEIPAEQRELIELAYLQDYTQSEIASELGIPLGTVKTRIRLGMQKLRSILHPIKQA